MNYYERIQKSIDYIESNLENRIEINQAAQVAYMSVSNFYRMFFALTGYSVKEYIRLRRISLGAVELKPMKAAYYCYYGREPENHAFAVIADWLNKNKLNI